MRLSNLKSQISIWANRCIVAAIGVAALQFASFPGMEYNAFSQEPAASQVVDPTSPSREMRPLFPASAKEIKAACPGASDSFLVQQWEAGATIFEAQAAHQQFQAAEIERLKTERTTLPAKKIAQIRDVCPGASVEFVLKLLESSATIDEARNAFERLRLAEIERLRSEKTQLVTEKTQLIADKAQLVADNSKLQQRATITASKVPPMVLHGRVLSEGDRGVARIEIDKQIYRIRQGQQLAITSEGLPMQIVAEEVSTDAVRLHLMPQNVRMDL